MSETSPAQPSASRSQQLGALDLGSNSFHLLVAQESNGRIQILDKHKEMVRLAEGITADNRISEEVMARALTCLERFGQRLRTLNADNVRVVGTNTLRKASHSGDFISEAERVLGHKIEIISGREEARLIYLGICHDIGVDEDHRLVIDIGGGSTELILGRKFQALQLESLHMGCVSMSHQHFPDGALTDKGMRAAINQALLELEPIAAPFIESQWQRCIGASGTINAVSYVLKQMYNDPAITPAALKDLRSRIVKAGNTDKLSLPGLATERKAVFAGGVAVLSAVFEALQIESMFAAQSALREGLIYDLLGRQHDDDVRDQTVASLMSRYRIDEVHARLVRETSLTLLSQVAMDWQLTEPDHKHIIGWGANLHEIGMDISHSGFHKHGSYLIEHMDMPGFSRLDQQRLATLVRTHRRKLSQELFGEKDLIRLAVLLRLAALLHRNRSHESLPHIQANAQACKADGESTDSLVLSVPQKWFAEHPLTVVDLENEKNLLANVGISLEVEQH